MPLREAARIEDIFAAVEDAELVLTHDAPLSQALNRRLRQPRIGRFAMTPRTYATETYNPRDERHVFHRLIEETGLDWREAAYALFNTLDCWDETGRADAIRSYERFDTPAIRRALPVIRDAAHSRDSLLSVDPLSGQAAVVGSAFLPALDRHILSDSVRRVSPFTGNTVTLPEFQVFPSATEIVDTIVENTTPENADQVAIVMDRGGRFSPLIESAFEATGIPYHGGPGFRDDSGVRTSLAVARASGAVDQLRLKDLRGILTGCGVECSTIDLDKRIVTLDEPRLNEVVDFVRSLEERSFGELLDMIYEWTDYPLEGFRKELDLLGLLDRRVTSDRVDDLHFYVRSFDVPIDRDTGGVLLADAATTTYVDRTVVYYLGLDADWTRPVPPRPWISTEQRDRQNLDAFQLLLQNGQQRYFLVQETVGGEPVVPSLYFHELADEPFTSFLDADHDQYGLTADSPTAGFDRIPIDARPEPPRTLSQSALNTLVNSPLDYCFDQLVESTDRDYFRKGSIFHDYAEFYLNHRHFVDRLDRVEFVDLMVEEMDPFVNDAQRELLRTEFRIGTQIIERFLRERPPEVRNYDGYRANFWSNQFADHFDRPITSPVTEQWFQNSRLGISGVVDLIQTPTRLIDYKSGNGNTIGQIVDQASIDPIHEKPNFQALLYLAHHRTVHPGEPLEFVFFHFLDVLDDAITGEYDLDDALVRVSYKPRPVSEYVASSEVFDILTGDVADTNPRRKTLEKFGYDRYREFLSSQPFPSIQHVDTLLDSPFANSFETVLVEEVGDYAYVRDGARSAIRNLHRLKGRMFFQEDVDAFEAFLAEQRDSLEEYHQTWFPVGDPNEDRLKHPDMVRTDD